MIPTMKGLPGARLRRTCVVALAAVAAAACGETSVNAPLPAGTISVAGGLARTGPAGQQLPDAIEVTVLGTDGQPLPGAPVTFTPTGAGAAAEPASATTDAQGVARTRWRLSTAAGSSTLLVTSGGTSAELVANVVAGPPATAAASAGATQPGVVGGAAAVNPAVRVLDAHQNPVQGAAVTFSVASGGGTLTDFVRTTNAQGIAAVGAWVFGPVPGPQTVLARVEHGGVAGSPVVFTASVAGGAAAQVAAASSTSQAAPAGSAVAERPSVRVTDAFGNPVANATVTFSVAAGAGQVSGGTQATNAQGIATVGGWTLGPQAGANQLTATVPGAGSVSFTATGTAGAAAQLSIAAGNNQSGMVSRATPVAPRVVVRDAGGNPVSGVVVSFAVTSGGGTVISGRQVSDAAGIAEAGAWLLGPAPGTNTLSASAPGLAPVTFTATAEPGQPTLMAAVSPTSQGGTAGTAVADPPSVVLRDAAGNVVPGVVVTFTVSAGGGTVIGSSGTAASTATATTSASGVATLTSWVLGPLVAENRVVASVPGVPGVTFTATPTAGAAARILIVSGDNATAVQGNPVATRPTVRVVDANNNPVANVAVRFMVTAGGGDITGGQQVTDATGTARVGSWTLGASSPNTLRATAVDNTGEVLEIVSNPITFTARAATALALVGTVPATMNRATSYSITVRLLDSTGSQVPLADVPLTLTQETGAGTLSGTLSTVTNANGTATFTIRIDGDAGDRSFTIAGAGLTSVTTPVITFN